MIVASSYLGCMSFFIAEREITRVRTGMQGKFFEDKPHGAGLLVSRAHRLHSRIRARLWDYKEERRRNSHEKALKDTKKDQLSPQLSAARLSRCLPQSFLKAKAPSVDNTHSEEGGTSPGLVSHRRTSVYALWATPRQASQEVPSLDNTQSEEGGTSPGLVSPRRTPAKKYLLLS